MSIILDGTNIENVLFNGTQLDKLIFNGVTVWENWKEMIGSLMSATYSQSSVSIGTKTATSSAISNGVKLREVSCTFSITNNDSYYQTYAWSIEGYTNGAWKTLKSGTFGVNAKTTSSTTQTYTDTSDDLYTQMRYSIAMKHAGSINGKVTKWLQKGA